jgi:CheY-like chemotaxis protein
MARSVEKLAAKHDIDIAGIRAVAPYVRGLLPAAERPSQERAQRTPASATQPSRSSSSSSTGSRATQPANKPRILVVDDSDIVREVLVRSVARFGFEVFAVGSGGEALDWLAENECDVILVDLNMPDLSGLELTSFVRSNPALTHLPIILLTSETDSARAVTGLGVGADDFVRKGVSEAEIAARVHAVLRRSRTPQGRR